MTLDNCKVFNSIDRSYRLSILIVSTETTRERKEKNTLSLEVVREKKKSGLPCTRVEGQNRSPGSTEHDPNFPTTQGRLGHKKKSIILQSFNPLIFQSRISSLDILANINLENLLTHSPYPLGPVILESKIVKVNPMLTIHIIIFPDTFISLS